MKETGSQGIGERDVAFEMGRQCPKGQEISLLLGLQSRWPGLQLSEARDSFLAGLAARYETANSDTTANALQGTQDG